MKLDSKYKIIEFNTTKLIKAVAESKGFCGFPLPESYNISEAYVKGIINKDGTNIYFAISYDDNNVCNNKISDADTLIADVWKNSILDTAYVELKKKILKYVNEDGLFMSDLLGPGYYGMPITEAKFICDKALANNIGIKVLDKGCMSPAFSRCGFFVVSKDSFAYKKNMCEDCLGNKNGCSMCFLFRTQK